MSKSTTIQVNCPRCGYQSPMTVWDSINVDLDPELKEKYLSGELFQTECEVCGLKFLSPFPTIYHDMEHRFMLFCSYFKDDEEKEINNQMEFPEGFFPKGYTFRRVFGMNPIKEKILIFEEGLNDITIERMKHFFYLNEKLNLLPSDEIFFSGIDRESDWVKENDFTRGAIIFVRLRQGQDSISLSLPMEVYYDYNLAVETDPRMKEPSLIHCIDADWMSSKLQNM